MPTNKQKREAARRHLERQLKRRAEREAARRRFTIIGSVLGTIILVAAVVIAVAVIGHKDKKKTQAATTPPVPTAPASSTGDSCQIGPVGKKITATKATGPSVTFAGATVAGATDLKGEPTVTSKVATNATKLQVKDLVVGKGAAASPTACVTVQYEGVLYKNGSVFDASWKSGYTTQFPLTGVVPGFTQGIGGNAAAGVSPMKIGGRRMILVPPALGYPQGQGSIPANSTLIFVVDLVSLTPQPVVSGG